MAIAFTIAGVTRTNNILVDSLRFNASLRSPFTVSFVSRDKLSTIAAYRPAPFDRVVITDGATTLFTGTISKVTDAPLAEPHIGTRVTVEATGTTALDRHLVNETYVMGPWPILNSSIGTPTNLTVVNHGFVSGQRVLIEGHQSSTPTINGERVVTVTGPNNFTIPINVTVAGGGGTVRRVVTLNEVVADLWGKYLGDEGLGEGDITWDPSNPTGPTIEAPVYDGVTVRAAFTSLQGLTGYIIRVTPGNTLQLFAPGAKVVPYSLTAANKLNVGPVTWDKSIGQYANSLQLKYGTEVQTAVTDIFTGTGALNNFPLRYVPVVDGNGFITSQGYVEEPGAVYYPIGLLNDITSSDVSDVITSRLPHQMTTGDVIIVQGHTSTPTINGTRTVTVLSSHTFTVGINITTGGTGGTFYSSALAWLYYPPTQLMYRTTVLADKVVAKFIYQAQFPQTLTVEDLGEIAVRGVWKMQRTITTLFDRDAAEAWGLALLRRSTAQSARLVRTATRQAMPVPGDTITLTYADKAVSGSHLLTDVSGSALGNKQMLWSLTGVSGTEAIDDWLDLLREQIGGTGGTVGGGGGIVSGSYIPPTSGGGGGGSGAAGLGTVGALAVFDTPNTVTTSIASQSGTVLTVAGSLVATLFTGSGAGLTSIPAGQLTGTINDARLSSNVPLLNAANAFTNAGTNSFVGTVSAGTLSTATLTAAANLTISPVGDLLLGPTGNDVLPVLNYDINLGALTKKFLTLHAAELWVETLVAQNTIATIGGRILVGPTTTLTVDLTAAATTISVKHNQMVSGDRVYLEANGSVEFMAITSAPSGSGPYTYTVTRNLDGTGANTWAAGDAMFNTGTTGNGFIDLYSVRGVKASTEIGPTIVGNVRTGTTYNAWAPRWAIGNLNGLYGYSTTVYGAAFGDYTKTAVTIDANFGFWIGYNGADRFYADTTGNLTLAGNLTVGTAGIIRSAGATALATGIGFYLAGGATPVFRVGNPSGNQVKWDGTDLVVVSATVSLGAGGITIATPPTSSGDLYAYNFATSYSGVNLFGLYGNENNPSGTRRLELRNDNNVAAGTYRTLTDVTASGGSVFAQVRCEVDMAGTPLITMTASLVTMAGFCNLNVGASVLLGAGGVYTWINDPNTYIANDSTDRLALVCGGSTIAFLAAGGGGFNALFPGTDNTYSLGTSTGPFRWTAVHAVNGTIQTSDRRLKRDIVDDTALGLAFVEALRTRGYRLLDDEAYRIGFIADEVVAALAGRPFAALHNPTGLMGLNYAGFVPVLVTAVQELAARVRHLEGSR